MQGEKYPTLGGVSRFITTLLEGLQGAMPPVHWQLHVHARWSDLPTIVQEVRTFILKDMLARWDPCDLLLCMGALTHPRHKSLSWLNPADKKRVIRQLHTEIINISGLNLGAVEEEYNDSEQPAKKPALASEEDDFNLLFGQKEVSEAEGQVQSDDHLQHIQDELERYLKEAEINFRKDDPLLWWSNHETYAYSLLVSKLRFPKSIYLC